MKRLCIKKWIAGLFFLLPVLAHAQFYYKDVVTTAQTNEQIKLYKSNRVKKVVIRSFEPTDEPTQNFICYQEVSPSFNSIKTFSQTVQTLQSVLTSQFNFKGQLTRSSDSSNSTLTVSTYTYDTEGKLAVVDISIQAYAYNTKETEKHIWSYKDGFPDQMLKIKNNSDTVVVTFVKDENGNVGEEEWRRNGNLVQKYYYYYDAQHRMTDLVRYNERAKRLLPDYIFEYNPAGQLTQMIAVQTGTSNYLTWRYQYNDKGLKEKESCYNKQKQLMGYVTYKYE